MQEKIARALWVAGFLTIAGGTGGFEQGSTVATYLCTIAAGVVMIAGSMFWYELQCVKAERRRQNLKNRKVKRNENGIKRRSDSY